MFKSNRNLVVGVFVTVSLLGIAGFTLWLAGKQGSEPIEHYSVLFEKDVSGLSLGGAVYYMGVNVGSVTNMVVVTGEIIRVRVDLRVLKSTPVDEGTTASLKAQGITGVTIINLSSSPGIHGPVKPKPGFIYPLIPIRQTGLSALLAEAPDMMRKISGLLDQANALLGEENRASIANTLSHIESLTGSLAQQKEGFASLPGEISDTLSDVRSAVSNLNGVIDEASPALVAAMENVNQATERLAALSARFDGWMADNEAEVQHFIENGLGQVPELISDARNMIRQLEKLLRELQDDPSQLIRSSTEETLEVNPE